jgi:beta-glucanase (GH16 family)
MNTKPFFFTLLMLMAIITGSCKKTEPVVTPDVSIPAMVSIQEGNAVKNNVLIPVTLNKATSRQVSLTWSTSDGTAKAGEDYLAVTASVLVFAPGETTKNIEVTIIGDTNLEFNDSFFIAFDKVTNATYVVNQSKFTIMNDDSYTPELVSDGYITPDTYPGMQNVWSDEFNGTALNTDWWTYEIGAGGWGNNEWQTYTNSTANASVSDGRLKIIATTSNGNYYSARLVTKAKKEFTYGRIDIRAKMPYGKGIWPALWMLGGNISQVSWPKCGEIDIMEYLGHDENIVYGTVHYDEGGHKYKGSSNLLSGSLGYNDQFHVFTIIWQESSITWYVDYLKYFEITSSAINYSAFKLPQFFIFNVAVGGNWPGYPDAATVFPQTMTVDYVRVFQTL